MFAGYRNNTEASTSECGALPIFPSVTSFTSEATDATKADGPSPAWLSCASFKKVPEQKPIVVIDDSSSDAERPREKRPREKRSKRRHREHDKKRKHDKKSRSAKKREDKDVISVGAGKGRSVFLEKSLSGVVSATTNDVFYKDTRQDLEHLHYGMYSKNVAKFQLKAKNVLGGTGKISELLAGNRSKVSKTSDRYFTVKRLGSALPLRMNSKGSATGLPEFLPIELSIVKTSDEGEVEFLLFDTKTQMYRITPRESRSEEDIRDSDLFQFPSTAAGTLAEDELVQENKRLNSLVSRDPHNIDLWVEFINFQDDLYGRTVKSMGASSFDHADATDKQEKQKLTMRGLLERKIAIVEKAIEQNGSSLRLKLLRMQFGQELWERERLRQEWTSLEFNHVNDPEMWLGQLNYSQCIGLGFKTTKHTELYQRCLEKLNIVREGKLLSHPASPHTSAFMAHVVVLLANFLKDSGHTEKSVAIMQAVLEFNLFVPVEIGSLSVDERRAFFEPFWDSRFPRFGDDGAIGWRDTLKQQITGSGDVLASHELHEAGSHDANEDEICSRTDLSLPQIWVALETLRSENHWLPWRMNEEPEDPERLVVFDDIRDFLIEFKDPTQQFILAQSFLRMYGAALLPTTSSSVEVLLLNMTTVTAEFETPLFDSLDSPTFNHSEKFICNCFDMCEMAFEGVQRIYFVASRLQTEMQFLLTNKVLSDNEKYQLFKKFAKAKLKQERNRSSLFLFEVYAECLARLGQWEESLEVLQSSINGHLHESWLSSSDNDELTTLLAGLNMFVLTLLKQSPNNKSRCLRFIASSVSCNKIIADDSESSVSSSMILRAGKILTHKFRAFISKPESAISSQSQLVGLVFLSTFTNLSVLHSLFQHCTGDMANAADAISQAIATTKRERDKIKQKGSLLLYDCIFLTLDRNLEVLIEFLVELRKLNCSTSSIGSLKELHELIMESIEDFPSNTNLLKQEIDFHLQAGYIVQLRRFFDGLRLTKSQEARGKQTEVWWLAALSVELRRLDRIRPILNETTASGGAIGEVNRIRHLFERATDLCRGSALLWRLWMEFEFREYRNSKVIKTIFYQAVRHCPISKDVLIDALRKQLTKVEDVIDLITERELRLRLPHEELELLLSVSHENTAL